jgi:hypothetical protein
MPEIGDTVIIDCVNSDQCYGHVTMRYVSISEVQASDRTDATMIGLRPVAHTCRCEYSEADHERLWDRARLEFDRQERG